MAMIGTVAAAKRGKVAGGSVAVPEAPVRRAVQQGADGDLAPLAEEPRDFTVRIVPEPGTRENPFVPLAAVARRLGVSKKTVRRMIYERGIFPGARRVESRICVPEQEVLAYVRALSPAVHA